jgi:uncharacterized membrane protein
MGYFILGLAIVLVVASFLNYFINKDAQDDTDSN